MKILLTNDDGYGSLGINLLKEVSSKYGEIVIYAPNEEKSGAGSCATFFNEIKIKTGTMNINVFDLMMCALQKILIFCCYFLYKSLNERILDMAFLFFRFYNFYYQ